MDGDSELRQRLEELLSLATQLCEECTALSSIKGMPKLLKRCQSERKFLLNLRKAKVLKESHLQSTNLRHLQAILQTTRTLPGVVAVLQPFHQHQQQTSLAVDLVCNHGYTWVKVIARKAQALHLIWAGSGQFGEKSIMDQADQYQCIALENPFNFVTPQIMFAFFNGVTPPLQEALQAVGIQVIGDIQPVDPDVVSKLESASVLDLSCDSGSSHEDKEIDLHPSHSRNTRHSTENIGNLVGDDLPLCAVSADIRKEPGSTCTDQETQEKVALDNSGVPAGRTVISRERNSFPVISERICQGIYTEENQEEIVTNISVIQAQGKHTEYYITPQTEDYPSGDKVLHKQLQADCSLKYKNGDSMKKLSGTKADSAEFPGNEKVKNKSYSTMVDTQASTETSSENSVKFVRRLPVIGMSGNFTSDDQKTDFSSSLAADLEPYARQDSSRSGKNRLLSGGNKEGKWQNKTCYPGVTDYSLDHRDSTSDTDKKMAAEGVTELLHPQETLARISTVEEASVTANVGNDDSFKESQVESLAVKSSSTSRMSTGGEQIAATNAIALIKLRQPLIKRINLDITTLISLVSNVCHGRCYFSFDEDILSLQAAEERNCPLLPRLQGFMEGKEWFACETAVQAFQTILKTVAGPQEKERAAALLEQIKIIPDNPSTRALTLKTSAKVKHRGKVIFGTGDTLQAITLTANFGFTRASTNQGVNFSVFIHEPRALTEQKEATAKPYQPQDT